MLLSFPSAAENIFPAENQENQAINTQIEEGFAQLKDHKSHTQTARPSEKKVRQIDNNFLTKQPELFHQAVQEAINSGNPTLLQDLTAAYRTLPEADSQTLRRAEAALARQNGDYHTAVAAQTALQRDYPEDRRIALDTAAVLFEDRQYREAADAFDRLSQDQALPEAVQENISRYRSQIRRDTGWQFGGSVSFSQQNNINDAAPDYCTPLGCTRNQAQSGTGLNYRLSASKTTPLGGHHNLISRSHISGVSYYFDRKSQYDSAFGRSYLGWQYQNARSSFSVLPFYQFQLAGTDEWSNKSEQNHRLGMDMLGHAGGVQIMAAHRFNPRLSSYVSVEHYQSRYREAERAESYDGSHTQTAAGASYRITPQQSLSAHIGRQQFAPKHSERYGRTNNAAYTRLSAGLGWQGYWPQLGGLYSSLDASFAHRRYKGTAFNEDFQRQAQRNREYSLTAALAHEKISYQGFLPKLVYEYSRTRSSHAWAERKQQQWFVEISKSF